MKTFYKDSSKIHGFGCFVSGHLTAGTRHSLPFYIPNEKCVTDKTIWIDDVPHELYNAFCFLNHSSNPNADLYMDSDGCIYLELLRDVQNGEEITFNYGEDWDG